MHRRAHRRFSLLRSMLRSPPISSIRSSLARYLVFSALRRRIPSETGHMSTSLSGWSISRRFSGLFILIQSTADSFLGNKISFYDAGLEVCHWGAANTQRVLRWIQASNLSPPKVGKLVVIGAITAQYDQVLVTGWQNGATGAAFHTSAISDLFPSANVTLLADNSFDLSR